MTLSNPLALASTTDAASLAVVVPDPLPHRPHPRSFGPAGTTAELRAQIARQAETVRELEGTCAGLERAVADRTREIGEVTERLGVVAQEAMHRGGNLLSIVQAITRQTAKGAVGLDDFVEALLSRLSSIALALRQVVVEEGSDAFDFARIVETQLQVYCDTYHGRIALAGPPLPMRADAARLIGLAIHELATNAVKHGALATPEGRVDVTWRLTRRDETNMLDFHWLERAVGREPRSTRIGGGFGTLLLRTALPVQLRGTSALTVSADSLEYRLEAPLP